MSKKALYKTISYRIIATVQALVLSYLYLGDVVQAGEFAVVSAIVGSVIYYLHEEFYRFLRKKGKI